MSMWSKEYWLERFDEQRLERLQQCQALGMILKQCEAVHKEQPQKNKKEQQKQTIPKLDEASVGIRMLKYYDWRYRIEVNEKGCIPEKHALWACRAVALGCGAHLGKLKACFGQQGMESVLTQPSIAYEFKDTNEEIRKVIPCAQIQQALGKCVTEKAKELQTKRKAKK